MLVAAVDVVRCQQLVGVAAREQSRMDICDAASLSALSGSRARVARRHAAGQEEVYRDDPGAVA